MNITFEEADKIREALKESQVISHRYMISVDGRESYEAVRFAAVRRNMRQNEIRERWEETT